MVVDPIDLELVIREVKRMVLLVEIRRMIIKIDIIGDFSDYASQ